MESYKTKSDYFAYYVDGKTSNMLADSGGSFINDSGNLFNRLLHKISEEAIDKYNS